VRRRPARGPEHPAAGTEELGLLDERAARQARRDEAAHRGLLVGLDLLAHGVVDDAAQAKHGGQAVEPALEVHAERVVALAVLVVDVAPELEAREAAPDKEVDRLRVEAVAEAVPGHGEVKNERLGKKPNKQQQKKKKEKSGKLAVSLLSFSRKGGDKKKKQDKKKNKKN
jgi:hypothetical protein